MAIYINPYLGSESRIFDMLLMISRCDPGLSSIPDVDVLEVEFAPKGAPSFSSGRLQEIIASPKAVLINGVDDSFILPWGGVMIDYGGVSLGDRTASTDTAWVWIDVTEAGGQGYRVLDANGNYIYAPMTTILFHELAHVYHALIVEDTPGDKTPDQLLAIADENQYRGQLGLPSRNPTVTIHDITGPPTVGPTTLKGCNETLFPDLCKCNIATVALSSPIARQIAEFRRAKRDLESLTFRGAPVLAPMWDAYQVFSPLVAGRMLADPSLRDLMLHFGVRSAAHLLRVVRAYMRTTSIDGGLVADLERIVTDYQYGTVGSREAQFAAAAAANRAAATLRSGRTVKPPRWCATAEDLFGAIAFHVQTSGADSHGTAWVLDGIAWFLRVAVDERDWAGEFGPTGGFGRWLTNVPLPSTPADIRRVELAEELTQLSARVFRHPELRGIFADRILAEFPADAPVLRDALQAAQYLATPESSVLQVN